jgi:hypothetical protein
MPLSSSARSFRPLAIAGGVLALGALFAIRTTLDFLARRRAPPPATTTSATPLKSAETARLDDELKATIDGARARAQREGVACSAGVRRAHEEGWVVRPDLGRCPIDPPPSSYFALALSPKAPSGFDELAIPYTTILASSSPTGVHVLSEASRIESSVATSEVLAEAKALERAFQHDIVLVVERFLDPKAQSRKLYTSGFVEGTAFVWDYARHEVICAAHVRATNSERFVYTFHEWEGDKPGDPVSALGGLMLHLRRDLESQTRRAAETASYFRVGPRRSITPAAQRKPPPSSK